MSARSTYADEERERLIIEMCKTSTSTDPLEIFENVASRPFVRMHGPEHHVLDGACLLATYRNAGGQIDLSSALEDLLLRGSMMPAAMCGKWGVCGAASSVGAALSLIEGTGPVSEDGTWGAISMSRPVP